MKIFSLFRIFEQLALAFKNSVPAKFSLYWIYFLPFKIFEQLCAYPEKQSLPWNFSLYSTYFLHSGFLSNLRLPWICCIEYIYFTVTCGEVRDWGGTVSFKAKFASVWIEWSSINSPLNWLLAEWLLLMLSIPYHNLLHTYMLQASFACNNYYCTEKKLDERLASLKQPYWIQKGCSQLKPIIWSADPEHKVI